MRILVTNDDGIDAPGLEVLEAIASALSDDVWMIAPLVEQSGVGRSITVTAGVRVDQRGPKRFRVEGTPTDCIVLGVQHIMKDTPPDLILSGVNKGQNLAEDTTQSGTLGAAFQGMILGVPSIGMSQAVKFRGPESCPWETTLHWGARVVKALLDEGWPKDVVPNINFPDCEPEDVTGVEVTSQGMRDFPIILSEHRTDLRDRDYYWMAHRGAKSDPPQGTDLRAIYENRISVTPLHLDLTHRDYRKTLAERLHVDMKNDAT